MPQEETMDPFEPFRSLGNASSERAGKTNVRKFVKAPKSEKNNECISSMEEKTQVDKASSGT
jgi:hypothetical protein